MAGGFGTVFVILLVAFIASIPLTWLSKYAWKSRKLFLIFSLMGVGSFLLMTAIVWNRL